MPTSSQPTKFLVLIQCKRFIFSRKNQSLIGKFKNNNKGLFKKKSINLMLHYNQASTACINPVKAIP
jgi:hypothetical protein